MTRNEMLKKAEQNLEAAERVLATSVATAAEKAEVRTKICHGWIQLARELRA